MIRVQATVTVESASFLPCGWEATKLEHLLTITEDMRGVILYRSTRNTHLLRLNERPMLRRILAKHQ